MSTTTMVPCSSSSPIEVWRTCGPGSNCQTLTNINNSPVDPLGMFMMTFPYDATNEIIGDTVILNPVPEFITFADRTSSMPFGSFIDNNWNWTVVPTQNNGIYQLTYTDPITSVTTNVGTSIILGSEFPPILTKDPDAFLTYFSYVGPTGGNPGRVLAHAYIPNAGTGITTTTSVFGTPTGRQFYSYATMPTQSTGPTLFDLGDIYVDNDAVAENLIAGIPINEGSPVGLYINVSQATPATLLALCCRVANQVIPTTGTTEDTANNNPSDLDFTSLTPSCTVVPPVPNSNLFPESDASVANTKNASTTKWVIIGILIGLAVIVIIVAIVVYATIQKRKKQTAELQQRVVAAHSIIYAGGAPPNVPT